MVFMLVTSDPILITGAAGFIGSHICEKMLLKGHEIIGIDNLNDYYNPKLKYDNLALLNSDDFHFFKYDIRDFSLLRSLFEKYTFNSVIHLAAQGCVRHSLENPFLYQDVNIRGTLNLLELIREFKCRNLAFALSSSVYGNQHKVPFSEKRIVNLEM